MGARNMKFVHFTQKTLVIVLTQIIGLMPLCAFKNQRYYYNNNDERQLQLAIAESLRTYQQEQEKRELEAALKASLETFKNEQQLRKNQNLQNTRTLLSSKNGTHKPLGLQNWSGVNCYMNATLQCLFNCIPFASWPCVQDSMLNDLFIQMAAQGTNAVNPELFALVAINKYFVENEFIQHQQDAEEFLRALLNDMKTGVKDTPFNASVKMTIDCHRCGHKTTFVDDEIMLPVIVPTYTTTLQQCITNFFSTGGLSSRVPCCQYCGDIKEVMHVSKNTSFATEPPMLIVQLKRFMTEWQNGQVVRKKNNNAVCLEKDIFTFNCNNKLVSYRLTGIILHSGSLNGGHYTALVRKNNTWFFCNDSWVSDGKALYEQVCNKGTCSNGTPYLLFFEKVLK